jgi:hypothetical protein
MNRVARAGVTLVAGGTMALTASPASAHTAPSEDGGDGWVPVETLRSDYYDPVDIAACGTTITMTTGDVSDVEARESTLPDGDVMFEARGGWTVDLVRHDTGQVIDELDISGAGSERVSADGTDLTVVLHGPSILFPVPELGPVDAAAFEAAGLPDLGYYPKGVVTITATGNPETGELLSEEIDVDARVFHLCTWFDDDRDRGDDRDDWRKSS